MLEDPHHVCPRFHTAIELIGARWTGAILLALIAGRSRYAQIKAVVPGVSDTMLTQRLRTLEKEGIVERRVIPDTPVAVEYHLTPKGRALEEVVEAVAAWSHTWISPPDAAPA